MKEQLRQLTRRACLNVKYRYVRLLSYPNFDSDAAGATLDFAFSSQALMLRVWRIMFDSHSEMKTDSHIKEVYQRLRDSLNALFVGEPQQALFLSTLETVEKLSDVHDRLVAMVAFAESLEKLL